METGLGFEGGKEKGGREERVGDAMLIWRRGGKDGNIHDVK